MTERDLPPDRLALIARLFAEATAVVEQAHVAATDGQTPRLTRGGYFRAVRALQVHVRRIEALAGAIETLLESSDASLDDAT